MFGEYAQIASFLSPRDGFGNLYGVDAMPEYLRPTFHPPQFWGRDKSGLAEDFIMIAEFSELEGPKPLMTIPKDGGGCCFDQNSFAVRILAVDHQTSTQGFSISEDAQVVLSDVEAGVFAFVHHLVLYDNTARGFVRPHCIAYITTGQRKLMSFYEEMSTKFKKVAHLIKYGNLLVFVHDLERHLKDLEHTKGFLLNQVSKQRLKESNANSDMRKNADNELYRKLQSIQQSTSEIKEILSILKPLKCDKRLENRFRLLEEKAFQGNSTTGGDKLSLQEDWFNDLSSLDGLDARCGSLNEPPTSPLSLFQPRDYKPLLVETKKAKRFNTPLRNLHELCSWGAKEGLKKLRCMHEYFKRDMVVLELEKIESKLMRPSGTSLFHGQCVTGNLLSGIHIKQYSTNDDEEEDLSSRRPHNWGSRTSLESNDSFKSADSFNSALIANNASPGSAFTIDSLNGNFFQSAPSSLERTYNPLAIEEDYFGLNNEINKHFKNSEKVTESDSELEIDKDEICPKSAKSESLMEKERNLMNRLSSDLSDVDEPPLLVFKQRIERPLSVVSLGCTDDENDSEHGEMDGNEGFAHKAIFAKSFVSADKKESGEPHECKSKLEKNTENVDICNRIIETSIKEKRGSSVESHSSSFVILSSPDVNKTLSENEQLQSKSCHDHPSHNDIDFNKEFTDATTVENKQLYDDINPCLSSSLDNKKQTKSNSSSVSNLFPQSLSNSPKESSVDADSGVENIHHDKASPVGDINRTYLRDKRSSSQLSSKSSTQSQLDTVFVPRDDDRQDEIVKDNVNDHLVNEQRPQLERSSPLSTNVQRQNSEAASSNQSDFTDVSIRDLFPYLADKDSSSPLPSDQRSVHSTCDTFETNDGAENGPEDGPTSANPTAWRPHHGLFTVGDWLNNLNNGRTGHGILEVLNGYSNLQHVVFSLMIGRPVLVVGVARLEPEVLKIINALTVFIPSTKKNQKYVLEWTSKPLRISDLSKLRLIGLCRPDRKSLDSFMPSAVKKASTVIDMEKRTIYAPLYQGHLIPTLLAKKKTLKSDAVMLSYIHWWLMDILSKAFIFFHSFYLGSAGSMISSTNLREHRDSYRATVVGIMGRLGIKDSDCSIVEHLAELTKLARLEPATQKLDSAASGKLSPAPGYS